MVPCGETKRASIASLSCQSRVSASGRRGLLGRLGKLEVGVSAQSSSWEVVGRT